MFVHTCLCEARGFGEWIRKGAREQKKGPLKDILESVFGSVCHEWMTLHACMIPTFLLELSRYRSLLALLLYTIPYLVFYIPFLSEYVKL